MQVVGGHRLVLLLDEAERREGEASVLVVAVDHHGGELVTGAAGLKQTEDKIDISVLEDFETFLPPGERLGAYRETKRLKMLESLGNWC